MHEKRKFTSASDALAFMQAGKARFTLRSAKTGTHFTYRVSESDDGKVFFVGVLTGADNNSSYSYLGIIRDGTFRRTAKSRISEDAPSHRAFVWALGKLSSGTLPDTLEVWHEGCCGRCGRTLTVPESIASGIGPECARQLGVDQKALPQPKHERDENMATTAGRRKHKQRVKQFASSNNYPTMANDKKAIDLSCLPEDNVNDLWRS